jgi:Uma2 family endonuclease
MNFDADGRIWTAVDLAERFGPVRLDRIRTSPAPGLATEDDLFQINDHEECHCELVDGVLIEKTGTMYEALVATNIAIELLNFAEPRQLGIVLGAGGPRRLPSGRVCIPDASFFRMSRFPTRRFPRDRALPFAPDLAVEVLSKGNTDKEMTEKLHDYFNAGTRLVWYVDPQQRHVQVFTSPTSSRIVTQDQMLGGGDVLPGFELSLKELFAELPAK